MKKGVQQKMMKLGMLILSMFGLSIVTPHLFANTPAGYVLEIQMTPAICLLDTSKVKKRKCLEGYTLNIQGLYPETSRRDCSTNSSATLTPLQAKVVARVMPDEAARRQLWGAVGGCTSMSASQYFRTIINYADHLKIPSVMTGQQTTEIHTLALQTMLTRLNKGLPVSSLRFQCAKNRNTSYLTELNICYATNGKYKSCSSNVVSNCPSTFTIKGSY
ncbi:ribonuclease T2 family protein [Acinetobacter portensis]|uniref:ribonuclease T2 family protein n=1 Tax=Acinetobacter portensis TaxID=1839785 RepID=UPI0013D25160